MQLPDVIIAALITLLGSVILAPLVGRLMSWIFERRAQLRMTVEFNDFEEAKFIKKFFDSVEWDNPRKKELKKWEYVQTLAILTFHNPSKKRLNRVSVIVTKFLREGFVQVDDGETEPANQGKLITVGDLQPGHSATLKLWSNYTWTDFSPMVLRDLFKVSADELDRVFISYPAPKYVVERYSLVPKWITRTWWLLVIFGGPWIVGIALSKVFPFPK